MNQYLIYILIGLVVIAPFLTVWLRRRPRKLNAALAMERWLALQKNCADKNNWPLAVLEADKLLDDTLKRLRYKGKSNGERLVAAQHKLSNNESVWFGHKLTNKIRDNDLKKIGKLDTLEALSGFRQALKDLGALAEKHPPAATDATIDKPKKTTSRGKKK
ncbi:MAG: hypothetical protein ABI602_01860 [Candidatus Saccharibacteria bacterium]